MKISINDFQNNLIIFSLPEAMISCLFSSVTTEKSVTKIKNDAAYYKARAQEELRKAQAAKMRGDTPAMIATHSELAVRYQAKAALMGRTA